MCSNAESLWVAKVFPEDLSQKCCQMSRPPSRGFVLPLWFITSETLMAGASLSTSTHALKLWTENMAMASINPCRLHHHCHGTTSECTGKAPCWELWSASRMGPATARIAFEEAPGQGLELAGLSDAGGRKLKLKV